MRPDSKLCFDFSLPVDKSHLEELESEKEYEKAAKYCPTKENVKDAEPSPATCSEVQGGRQLETVKDLVEEVLESVILAGQGGGTVEEIIEDLIKDVDGRESLDVVGCMKDVEVFQTPPLHYGEDVENLEEALVEELAKVGSQIDVQFCSDDVTEAKGVDNSRDDGDEENLEDLYTSEVLGNLEGREYGEDDRYLEEVLDAELGKEGVQIVVEVLSDDITEANEEDDYYEDDLNTSCMLFSEKLMRSLEEAPDDESCNDEDDFGAEDYPGDLNESEEESEEEDNYCENDLNTSGMLFSEKLSRSLEEEYQCVEEALDAELAEEGIQSVVDVLSDDLAESKDADSFSEDDHNNSMLFSEKLSRSLEEEPENDHEGRDPSADENNKNLNECKDSEDEYDDNEGTFSNQILSALDKHFMDRPIMLVRGVYKSGVLQLTVRRPTYGVLVSWTLEDMVRKKFVFNVKAKMRYAGNIADGHKHGHRLPGGQTGRGWEGFGYGFCNLFPGSDSSIKHVDLHEAVFPGDSLHNHYSSEDCIISPENPKCREPGCGAKVWTIQFKTFTVTTEETAMSDLQPRGWSLRKDKLMEVICLSMVGFYDGSHQLVLHRESDKRSHAEIAWFQKDPSAYFQDVPDVDENKLDGESFHIWDKSPKFPKAVRLSEEKGDSVEHEDNHEFNPIEQNESEEFLPSATSTPIKCKNATKKSEESNSQASCHESCHDEDQQQFSMPTTPVRRKLNVDLDPEKLTGQETTLTVDGNTQDHPPQEFPSYQNKITVCDLCHFKGNWADHLRESKRCLDHIKSLNRNIVRGDDETFIIKSSLLIGECPSPSCPGGGNHIVIPEHCLKWWKSDGWGKMAWRGESVADDQTIRKKILNFLKNMRRRANSNIEREMETRIQPSCQSVLKCESCSFRGGIVQHLLEEGQCLSAYAKKYLPQGESFEGDVGKRKSIMKLSFVLNLCALPSCSNRHLDCYVANHLTKNVQCLLFYQTEGAALAFPWGSESSARIIGKKIQQIKRTLKDKVAAEEKTGVTTYSDELAALFTHVCYKCGAMGPPLPGGDQSCQMTPAATESEGSEKWRCSKCMPSSPSFSQVKESLAAQTEDLKKISERELRIAFTRPTEEVTFCLPDVPIVSNHHPPERFDVSLMTKILVPIEAPAVKTVLDQCEEAFKQKARLDNFRHEMMRRPFIVDIPGALAALYKSKLAAMRAVMKRLLIGLSQAARGEIVSMDLRQTNAVKKKANVGLTMQGALRDTCPFSLPAQELRSKQSAARANVQGFVKSRLECTILKNIEDKELQRILLTASHAFGPVVQNVNELEPIFLLAMAPIIVKFLHSKVQLLLKHIVKPNYSNYDLKMVFSGDNMEVKLVGYVYSPQFDDANKEIAKTAPGKLPQHIINDVINQRDVIPTVSLDWREVAQRYDLGELSAKNIVSLAKQHQIGEKMYPLSCLDMWSTESWKPTEAEMILKRRAVTLSQAWNDDSDGDDTEEAIIQITQTLLEEGLFEDMVTESIDAAIIRDLKQRLYDLNPERDDNSLKTLLWYHVLLLKTSTKEWTFARKCGQNQVLPYHPILLAAVENFVQMKPVLEGESFASVCEDVTDLGNDSSPEFWKEVTLLEFVSWIMLENYEDLASSNTVGIITTPEQLFNFTEATERDDEVDDVFTNSKNEAFVITNGDVRKLYMKRPPAMGGMTLAQFAVQYYKKHHTQKAVIDPISGLGEESTDPVVGSDEMAPKAMQLNNMIIMKRRTRDLPVPLLMFTDALDNYGEQVLFQPWCAQEELTNVRTEEEGRERIRRQLELFPMAVFKREEDAS